jgi:hypothetical protein
MDAGRFDTLARSLTAARSRRGALAAALAGLLGMRGLDLAEARKKKGCPPCKRRKQGKCKKKKPDGTACPGGTCHGGRCTTCSDGIKNGSETGVDCGGNCPRCATGQGCTSRNDCASALCSGGTCQTCEVASDDCGSDANGNCNCRQTHPDGAKVCIKNTGTGDMCDNSACPPGAFCINNVGIKDCFKPCGAP